MSERRDVTMSLCWNIETSTLPYIMTSPRHETGTSSHREIGMSRCHHVVTLELRDVGVFDTNVMSSHFRSHHVTFTSWHVATAKRHDVLGLDEQRRDVDRNL